MLREIPRSLCFSLFRSLKLRTSLGSCLKYLRIKLHRTSLSTRMSTTLGIQEHLVTRGGAPHSYISSSIFFRAHICHSTSQASVLNSDPAGQPEGPSVTSHHQFLYSAFLLPWDFMESLLFYSSL